MTDRTLYHGGTVYPLVGGSATPAEAVLTEDHRVIAVGDLAELRERAGPGARRVNLDGAVLLPGFIDSHPHLLHFGTLAHPLVDVLDATSQADIVTRVADRAASTPAGTWIMTTPVGEPHYFLRRSYRDLAEGELPDRAVLDRATGDHPVVVQAWAPRLPATMALNSPGLAALGIDRNTPDRVGNVWVDKDSDGEPTGRLRGSVTNYYADDEFAAALWRKIPFLDDRILGRGTVEAVARYHSLGVTAAYENHMMDGKLLDTYRELRAADRLDLRVLCSQEAESYGMPWSRPRDHDDFVARLDRARDRVDRTDRYLRFNGVTVMWDGVFSCGGMMMKRPYVGPYGETTSGRPQIDPDRAAEAMRYCARHGLRLNLICMGTGAHEEALSTLERVAAEYDLAALRWVLVHAVFIEPDQVARYRRLNFDLTTSMSFPWADGEDFHQRIGPDSLTELAPLRWFFDAGFAVAGATDWGPKSVFEQIQLALTHTFASGRTNLGPAQRISRAEALRMWTSDAARVLRWNEIGSLRPGSEADLVLLDRDPFTAPVDDLATTTVLRTVFDGREVYDTGALR